MRFCAIIPCYNHGETLGDVIEGLPDSLPAIVVDDGSDTSISTNAHSIIRLEKNSGKAAALVAGFKKATELGFTHALTLDADNQHDPRFAEKFMTLSLEHPNALIAGVRDFDNPAIPPKRRFMNRFSNFWFRFETSTDLKDTQCGYRLYPMKLINGLNLSCTRYAFEAEILVKCVWSGGEIIPLEIPTIYTTASTQNSHYRAFWDTLLISLMNTKLSFMKVFFTDAMRKRISQKKDNA